MAVDIVKTVKDLFPDQERSRPRSQSIIYVGSSMLRSRRKGSKSTVYLTRLFEALSFDGVYYKNNRPVRVLVARVYVTAIPRSYNSLSDGE